MNAFVVSGLVKRRADLAGEIERTHETLRKMVLDLENLDATILQFEPDFKVETIRPKANFALRGCVIAALLFPLSLSGQENEQPKEPTTKSETEKQPTIVLDTSVFRSIFDDLVKIFRDEKTANEAGEERKERREEADLVAQQRQAKWAKWLFIITAIQLPLGIATLGLLYFTFMETRRTAKAAVSSNEQTRRLFVAEQRPWIQITVEIPDDHLVVDSNGVYFRPKIKIESSGKSPAKNVRQRWAILPDAKTAPSELERIAAAELAYKASKTDTPGDLLFPGREQKTEPKLRIKKPDLGTLTEITPALIGCITYEGSLTEGRFQTVYFSRIEKSVKDQPTTFAVDRDGMTGAVYLRYKDTFIRDSGIAGTAPPENESYG